jgi:hypothetical protein
MQKRMVSRVLIQNRTHAHPDRDATCGGGRLISTCVLTEIPRQQQSNFYQWWLGIAFSKSNRSVSLSAFQRRGR